MLDVPPPVISLLTALGVGLLVGTVRERQAGTETAFAGVRTHSLAALLGACGALLGALALGAVLALIVGLVLIGYWRTSRTDIGATGEIALAVTALLGALAVEHAPVAAGAAVVVAGLLYAKRRLHALARDRISEREVQDGLLLLAAALIVLPLVPDHAIGPAGGVNPSTLWRLVVLIMAVSALGHVVLRVVGGRWGLPLAGFFAGFVSSTAAVAGFGQRAKDAPAQRRPAVAAALLATLASLSLTVPILLAAAPSLVPAVAAPLVGAGLMLALGGLLGLRGGPAGDGPTPTADTRMFRIGHALLLAAMITGVTVGAMLLRGSLGVGGAIVGIVVAAAAELHASIASVGQLFDQGGLSLTEARWGLVALLAASAVSKLVIAFASGGRGYGARIGLGMLAMVGGATVGAALAPRLPWP
ncbi:MAG: DUF4010 domain-containing protein [Kofleriaceae bacterium]